MTKMNISNIQNLQWWVDAINFGTVLALAGSLLFGGFSFFMSKKLNALKDEYATQEKQASDERNASANAIAETAKSDAEKANVEAKRIEGDANKKIAELNTQTEKAKEGLAKSNKEIARITLETETAKKERAEADKQIAIAKNNAAQANKETATLSLRVEEESSKRAEAELALLQLEKSLARRQIPFIIGEDGLCSQNNNFLNLKSGGLLKQ